MKEKAQWNEKVWGKTVMRVCRKNIKPKRFYLSISLVVGTASLLYLVRWYHYPITPMRPNYDSYVTCHTCEEKKNKKK